MATGLSYNVNVAAGTDLFGGRGHIEGAIGYINIATACCSLPGTYSQSDWRAIILAVAQPPGDQYSPRRPDGLNVQRPYYLQQLLG